MAKAMIAGIANNYNNINIYLFDILKKQYEPYMDRGFFLCENVQEAVTAADYIFICVRPQEFELLAGWIKEVKINNKIFISIMAGVPISKIISLIGHEAAIIRTMPNAPLSIGKGVTAMTRNSLVSDQDFNYIKNIFDNLGKTIVIQESQMTEIVSVNASAPAYVYLFIKAMCDGAAAQGFSGEEILELICLTAEGSAQLLRESGKSPAEMVAAIASKGGTTEAALGVLRERGFEQTIADAMLACTKRAEELGKG